MNMLHLLVLLALVSLCVTLIGHAAVFFVLRSRGEGQAPTPGISVLKPIKGDEPGLYENLSSLAAQDYPSFELIIGAEDPNDPGLRTARRVQADHPHRRIVVSTGARKLGLNPKVNLLAALSDEARNDYWLISDSNVRVGPSYLAETAAEFADPEVGLVTNLVCGDGRGIGAALENLQLAGFVAGAISMARALMGRACVVGKSMLFRGSDLQRLGGFHAVRNVLAEDYIIGRTFELSGYKVALSRYVISAMSDGWTLERFFNRHLRWAQMRRRVAVGPFFAELLMNPVLWASVAAGALAASSSGLDRRFGALLAAGVVVKCLADLLVARRLSGRVPHPLHVALIPAKDLAVAGIWFLGFFRRTVNWRGNRMRIERGSVLRELVPALSADEDVESLQEAA